MTDTNWCTFCDCAINPNSDFIYCSEECFKLDALANQPLYYTADEPKYQPLGNQTQQSALFSSPQSYTSPISSPQFDQSRRGSSSSVSSEDLAAMYFDMLPSTPTNESAMSLVKPTSFTTPLLSTSISPACSHEEALKTPTGEYPLNLPLQEKETTTNIYLSHFTMF
ncbi:unnamed protein product [Mucor hiemalis]